MYVPGVMRPDVVLDDLLERRDDRGGLLRLELLRGDGAAERGERRAHDGDAAEVGLEPDPLEPLVPGEAVDALDGLPE